MRRLGRPTNAGDGTVHLRLVGVAGTTLTVDGVAVRPRDQTVCRILSQQRSAQGFSAARGRKDTIWKGGSRVTKTRSLVRAVALTATALLLGLPGVAGAQQSKQAQADTAPYTSEGSLMSAATEQLVRPGHENGGEEGHLTPRRKNVELIGKLEPTGRFGDIVEGQIADLAVFKRTAYLNSWSEPTCTRGGVYVVDIKDPRRPREIGFLPALAGNYHGEGAHVISVETKAFKGDLLAVN